MTSWFTTEKSVNEGRWNGTPASLHNLSYSFLCKDVLRSTYGHLQILEGWWKMQWVRLTCATMELGDSRHWVLPSLWYSLLLSMCRREKRCFPRLSEGLSSGSKSRTLWEDMCHVTYLRLGKSEVIVMPKITAGNEVEVGRACKIFTMPWGHWTLLWLDMPTLGSSKD